MDEKQYILRLPDPLVERMRFALASNKRRDAAGEDKKASSFNVDFKDERNAVFTVDGADYPATMMDLPTIVETHKTADRRTFFKSGDLHQVLVVRMPDEPPPEGAQLKHGLTPAAQEAGKRLQQPKRLFSPSQVESVEMRVKMVIDHKIKLVPKSNAPKKDGAEAGATAPADEMEVVIEEETTIPGGNTTQPAESGGQPPKPDAPPSQPAAGEPSPPPTARPAIPASVPAAAPAPVAASPSPSPDVHPSPMPSAATPLPAVATPSAATPLPESEPMDDDEPDEDDMFAEEMAGALMEGNAEDLAQKRIERANLNKKILEQKEKITQLEAKAAKAPNAVLRMRILSKRGDLQASLSSLEKERAELGDNF